MSKYTHLEKLHNLKDPEKIVPLVVQMVNPTSVVDIGCGTGNFLFTFKKLGIGETLGIDGCWVNKKLLEKYLDSTEFQERDLEKPFELKKKYDLVLSLEVAEHLSKDSAEMFVQNLIEAGNVILFSAAIPGQGGQNHINEQWLSYWQEIFLKKGYVLQDVLRPLIWNDPDIFWWYRQNMVFFTPKDFKFKSKIHPSTIINAVHYELYESKCNQLRITEQRIRDINMGKKGKWFYTKLLLKSIYRTLKF